MDEIKFKYNYTLDDLLSLSYFIYFNKKILKISISIFIILLFLTFLLGIASGAIDWFLVLFILFFVVVFIVLNPLLIRYRSKKAFINNKLIQRPFEFTINENGIIQITEDYNATYKWSDIYSASENKHHFFLFVSTNVALLIPKSMLNDKEGILRNHILNTLPKDKYKNIYKIK